MHVGLLNHDGQLLSAVRRGSRNSGKWCPGVAWGLELDVAGGRVPGAVAVDIAAVQPLRRLLVVAGAAAPFDIEFHQALDHELHHLAQPVDVGPLLGEFGQCHGGDGHR